VACFSRCLAARPAGKLDFDGPGWGAVRTPLDWKWSPQQIAATLERVCPDEPERPVSHETEVDDRVMPGQWEGDLIKGAGNKSSVGAPVERTSRPVLLAKMDDATAASALAGFPAQLNSIAAPLRQGLTYDQGKEMSRRADLAAQTGVKVCFCDPHSPWQRSPCENTNGLIRQFAQTLASFHKPSTSVH